MTGSARPRHIRDIAHLYLSRRKVPAAAAEEGPGPLHLCITSSGRNCMSGFHTANLAAALAERQSDVRIFDLSGAQPNASFYFSHPPALYLDYTGDGRQRFIPALPRVSIAFDLDARPRRVNSPGARPVTIYHLPPDDMESMREVWRSLEDRVGGRGWRVHLTDQPLVDEAPDIDGPALRGVFMLSLAGFDGSERDCPFMSVGELGAWRWALVDRLPIVVRDPMSRLARAYTSTCESLLARITTRRRVHDVEPARRAVSSGRPR